MTESSNELRIRLARPGDEAAIHDAHMRSIREVCVRDHGEDEVRGWGNRPLGDRWTGAILERRVWVVEQHGRIEGQGCLRLDESAGETTAHLLGLYLTPAVLGRGAGAGLLRLVLERARAAGAKRVTLDSTITAHGFYRRFGFVDTGPMTRTNIGGSMVRSFPMELRLD